MCGILGAVGRQSVTPAALEGVSRGLHALARRGPDGAGRQRGEDWLLGQTRLAVLDLTERAAQPMQGARGTWLVFNGEIYNFRELRRELEDRGVRFDSTGDTQVLLAALETWGLDVLPRLRGMFAFGWLDPQCRQLTLARDRYGVKPLVWERTADGVRFASDLFALDDMAGQARDIDAEQVRRFLVLGYVPAPYTIWKGPRKLRPGCYLRVQWGDKGAAEVEETAYWRLSDIPPASEAGAEQADYARFKHELVGAVASRLISDVPVGLLLSGGVDSSLVGAAYAELPGHDIPSFTMGFDDPAMDERAPARSIATQLGLQHRDFVAEAGQVAAEFDALWRAFDEPFADASALPMLTLCRNIAQHVKVAIGGDGGDEVWCGYPWHRALARAENATRACGVRGVAALGAQFTTGQLGMKLRVLAANDRLGAWATLRTGLSDDMARALPIENGLPLTECFRDGAEAIGDVADACDWASRMDLATYLPDDLMVKADRASMHFGLELREPLLDHGFTAFGIGLPVSARFDRATGQGKRFARRYLAERFSQRAYERPKQGFTPPLKAWLDGPLAERKRRTIADLEAGRLAPLMLPAGMRSWDECATRLDDRHAQFLWRVMCFAGWLDASKARRAGRT